MLRNIELTAEEQEKLGNKRILRFMDDQAYNTGVLILCDDAKDTKDYMEIEKDTYVWTFPLDPSKGKNITLHALKMREKFDLFEENSECPSLNSDSYFYAMLANKDNFKSLDGEQCDVSDFY